MLSARYGITTLAFVLLVLSSATPAAAMPPSPIANGGFETGNLGGWISASSGNFSNDYYVYSGTSSPVSGHTVASPPEGTYAVVSDEVGPGTQIITQNFTVPSTGLSTLTMMVYYDNLAGIWVTPNSLATTTENQQYRIDVLKPGAAADSMAASDILGNVFRTTAASPMTLAPTLVAFDLTPYAGQMVKLRVASVETDFFLMSSVDDVFVSNGPAPGIPTPELGPAMLVGVGLVATLGLVRVAKSKK